MSIYDHRDKSAYVFFKTESRYAKNPHILKWWSPSLDELLVSQISRWQWVWYWGITEKLIENTSTNTIQEWKRSDPLCTKCAWYNVLMYFAVARAEQMGFTRSIRRPRWKICPLCSNNFVEDSLPMPLIERLGIDGLDFCAPCLKGAVLQGTGSDTTAEEDILQYLRDLACLLACVPTQNFGEGMTDILNLSYEERVALLKLLKNKPSVRHVKSVFGSWLNALIQAGILEDNARRTGRGIQSLAKDGHICFSLGEKTIDDYLHIHGIPHDKEPKYPESNYRSDFKVGEIFIEFFGLVGNPDYDAKTKEKIRLCKKHHITLVEIYPQDLISQKRLDDKLSILALRS